MRRSRHARRSMLGLLAALGVVGSAVGTAALPSSASPRWSIVPSVSPTGQPVGELSAVACSSATDCVAVGGSLFEHWDGAAWSIVSGPTAGAGPNSELAGASCPSAMSCFAVGASAVGALGSETVKALIMHWDGSGWTTVSSPTPSGGPETELSDVSCASVTNCFAVGSMSSSPFDSEAFTGNPLVEHWDGTTWSIVPSPGPVGAIEAELVGVSCPSATSCFAVGDFEAPTLEGVLLEHWDGSSWSIMASPDSSIATTSAGHHTQAGKGFRRFAAAAAPRQTIGGFSSPPRLDDVSCPDEVTCFASGATVNGALVERWNGATWSTVDNPTPPSSEGGDLAGVSCSSATDCSAVGDYGAMSGSGGVIEVELAPVAEHWDGTRWSIEANPPGGTFHELTGVSCPGPANCFAVGDSARVQHWNGTAWSFSPFATKTSQSALEGVSCRTVSSCFAVGSALSGMGSNSLVERWNGTTWSAVRTPAPGGAFEVRLEGVTCPSATDCFAVGSYATFASINTLIEHWNGRSWSIVPSPDPTKTDIAALVGVACSSVTNCTAVGFAESQTAARTLIEHWDGKGWSIVPSPSPSGALELELIGVSCPSATSCTAVGTIESLQGTRSPGAQVVIEQWDGTTWSLVHVPNPPGVPLASLVGVSCSSTTDCVAVGYDAAGLRAAKKPLAERWNGKAWSVMTVRTPPGATGAALLGVACRSVRSCYATGYALSASGTKTLVEHWDGTAWSIAPTPNPNGATTSLLTGVSCPSPASCTAVGTYSAQGSTFTLVETGA